MTSYIWLATYIRFQATQDFTFTLPTKKSFNAKSPLIKIPKLQKTIFTFSDIRFSCQQRSISFLYISSRCCCFLCCCYCRSDPP